jgi:hypothetical protein
MPCYAFVAILLGSFINKAWEENKARLYPFIILLVINIALPIAAYLGIKERSEYNWHGEYSCISFNTYYRSDHRILFYA